MAVPTPIPRVARPSSEQVFMVFLPFISEAFFPDGVTPGTAGDPPRGVPLPILVVPTPADKPATLTALFVPTRGTSGAPVGVADVTGVKTTLNFLVEFYAGFLFGGTTTTVTVGGTTGKMVDRGVAVRTDFPTGAS